MTLRSKSTYDGKQLTKRRCVSLTYFTNLFPLGVIQHKLACAYEDDWRKVRRKQNLDIIVMFFSGKPAVKPLKHIVVTTFNSRGYKEYGKSCLETFLRHWPKEVSLLVYAEDVKIDEDDPRLILINQAECLPKLIEFRQRFREDPRANGILSSEAIYDFRWDAVKFSNKVFAVADAIRRCQPVADHLIWLDADTVTHRSIPQEFLDGIAPTNSELASYLNRRIYPECGWVGYNLKHENISRFAKLFEHVYSSGEFLALTESHDSHVFWLIVKQMKRDREAKFKLLGSRFTKRHVFINSVLGGYMDHLKGERKALGKSPRSDLKRHRKEGWWT